MRQRESLTAVDAILRHSESDALYRHCESRKARGNLIRTVCHAERSRSTSTKPTSDNVDSIIDSRQPLIHTPSYCPFCLYRPYRLKKNTLRLLTQEYLCLFECCVRYLAAREHLRNLAYALRL